MIIYSIYCTVHAWLACPIVILEVVAVVVAVAITEIGIGTGVEVTGEMTETSAVEDTTEMMVVAEEVADDVPSALNGKEKFRMYFLNAHSFRFDDKSNHMVNAGPPSQFPGGPRERRSRWDPVPRQGVIEKNFYVIHPDVAQRHEVIN